MDIQDINKDITKDTRLHLATLEQSRRSFARIIRSFYAGKLDEARFRTLVYAMTAYLGFLRLGEEIKANTKLDELISLLKARGIE